MSRPIKVKDPHRLLLDSAKEIIISEGRKELTARNLSKTSGYALGSVYVHFDDLDDLILQINGETLESLYYYLNILNASTTNSPDKLVTVCQGYFDFALENKELWDTVMSYQRTGKENHADWYEKKIDTVTHLVEEIIEPHLKRGQNRKEMAQLLWAGLQGIWLITLNEGFKTITTKQAKKMVEILVKNLFN